jgi:hypothetical protein
MLMLLVRSNVADGERCYGHELLYLVPQSLPAIRCARTS